MEEACNWKLKNERDECNLSFYVISIHFSKTVRLPCETFTVENQKQWRPS